MEKLATDSSSSQPLLDINQLETFIDLGLIDFLDLLGDVTHDVPEHIAKIHSTIREGNETALKARCHSMRGMLANFGCIGITGYLHRLEYENAVSTKMADTVRAELEELWVRSFSAIKDWENSVAGFAT